MKKGGQITNRSTGNCTNSGLEQNSGARKINLKFVNKPLSNFNLMNYVK